MSYIKFLFDFLIHLDKHLIELVNLYGFATHFILFAIVFCETGLVVTPFLPGDSLLFASGTLCRDGALNSHFLFLLLTSAAILGDNVNYWVGRLIGDKIYKANSKFIKKEYFDKTQAFYVKHGVKTVILARFVPIVRTFAPFVAGIGKMNYSKYLLFDVIGGIAWVGIFVYSGFFFGNLPFIKNNFTVVVFAIIIISVMPAVIEFMRHKFSK